jgi:hypothetical protein
MSTPNPVTGAANSASLSTLIATLQNLVTALNNATKTQLNIEGAASQENISTATWIAAQNRLCRVSIVAPGTATGTIYDASNASDISTPIWTIPTALGMVKVSIPITDGLLVVPGTGQNVTVSWS